MKPQKQFKPQSLRSILSALLVILVLGGAALFYLGLNLVRDYAVKVDQRLADAEASRLQVGELQLLKGQLAQSNSLVEKANLVFATPGSYQAQVLGDLKKYADAAGLTLGKTTFGEAGAAGTYTVKVNFGGTVSYSKFIAFLHNIEGNLPKLEVTSLSLGRATNGSPDSIKIEDINISVSVR